LSAQLILFVGHFAMIALMIEACKMENAMQN